MSRISPLKIKILFHYYLGADEEYPDITPASVDITDDLILNDLLGCNFDYTYYLTEKGEFYIQAILRAAGEVMYPVWSIPPKV